jgi:hypothetical protein
MASPIFTPKNYIQIYDQMEGYIVGMGIRLSNFNVGSIIRTILEALSLVQGQSHYEFFQGLLAAIPVSLYSAFGFTKKGGTQAGGFIRIAVETNVTGSSLTVPLGITINVNGNDYITLNAGVIQIGQKVNDPATPISIQSVSPGLDKNISAGDIAVKAGQGFFVGTTAWADAYNEVAFTQGTDEESETDRRNRFLAFINGLTRSTYFGMLSAILGINGVKSVYERELFPTPGWVTFYVDNGTGAIPTSLMTLINKVINGYIYDSTNYPGYRGAGIRVSISAPTVHYLTFVFNIKIDNLTISNPSDILVLAKTALEDYVNGLTMGEDFILNEGITAIINSHIDIIDATITYLHQDWTDIAGAHSVTVSPPANIAIGISEIAKVTSDTATYTLIDRVD